jgi:hypothetical protein
MAAGTRSRRQADNLSTIGVVDVNSPEQKAPSEEDLVTDDDRLEFTTLMKLTNLRTSWWVIATTSTPVWASVSG